MFINAVGSAFTGNSGSGQNTGGTPDQTDATSEDTTASSDGTEASAGSSSTSTGSSNGQTGSQSGGQTTAVSASNRPASSQTGTSMQIATLSVETEKTPVDEDALRTQALEVQKRMNTDMMIRSLGASTGTGLSLLSGSKAEAPVPLAVAAYAENFNRDVTGPAEAPA